MDHSLSGRVNPLLESCAQLFTLLPPLRVRRSNPLAVSDDFRDQVQTGFDVMERMARERKIAIEQLDDARYAMAALIDESVLASEWSGRAEWMAHPLQTEMFGEHLAGEGFFKRLERFRQGGDAYLDLLELYYTCLQFGFEGVYKLQGMERLMALQASLRSMIDGYRRNVESRLAPEGAVDRSLLARLGRTLPYRVIASLTVIMTFLLYSGFAAVTYRETERSVAVLKQDVAVAMGMVEPPLKKMGRKE